MTIPGDVPRTLVSFKKYAKKYARERGLEHIKGLEELARVYGFSNYISLIRYYEERANLGDKTR